MELDEALKTYIAESRELLQEMERLLLNAGQERDQDDFFNALFRSVHTIKGSAGLFGLDHVVAFTHGVESLMDNLRTGMAELGEELVALLLRCHDFILEMMDQLEMEAVTQDAEFTARGEALTKLLKQAGASCVTRTLPASSGTPTAPHIERVGEDGSSSDCWHISLRFGADVLRNGMDPLSFLHYLTTIGHIVDILPLDDRIPTVTEMDPELCYLGFEITYRSDADKQTIENVFEFVRDSCQIRILPPHSNTIDYINLIQELPEEGFRLGEILVRSGALTQAELDTALCRQEQQTQEEPRHLLGNIVLDQGMVSKSVVDSALDKQSRIREGSARESQSIRVDAHKLDELVNLIGELVIATAGMSVGAAVKGDDSLIESASTLSRLVEEVRGSALSLRMVQIGPTFNRFQRVVRDAAKELDKEINLIISGAETELDKTVVEKISDPLMHLVRNAIDHGLEKPDDRQAAGKPRAGTVRLNAYHDSGTVVIEVCDDGKGLNRDKILKKAIENGLVSSDQNMEEHDVFNLIFEPGFSTADKVSNLSGRGVGMDVVKRNVQALRGTVEVSSTPGFGTTISVTLPLTLAIIDGFLVEVENTSFVVPLDSVLECVELQDDDRARNEDDHFINLRGEILPFICLRKEFDLGGGPPPRENIVVFKCGGIKAGLLVDSLIGEFQTVIKPLGRIFTHLRGVGGSTILGSGQVALILDVQGLIELASKQPASYVAEVV